VRVVAWPTKKQGGQDGFALWSSKSKGRRLRPKGSLVRSHQQGGLWEWGLGRAPAAQQFSCILRSSNSLFCYAVMPPHCLRCKLALGHAANAILVWLSVCLCLAIRSTRNPKEIWGKPRRRPSRKEWTRLLRVLLAVQCMGGAAGCVGRVGHGPPKILVGWATMHLAPPIIGLYVR